MSRQYNTDPSTRTPQGGASFIRRVGQTLATASVITVAAASSSLARPAKSSERAKSNIPPVADTAAKKPSLAQESLNRQVHGEEVSMARKLITLAKQAEAGKTPHHMFVEILHSGNTGEELVLMENTGTKIFNGDPGQYKFFVFLGASSTAKNVVNGNVTARELDSMNPEKVQKVLAYEEEIAQLNFTQHGNVSSFSGTYPQSHAAHTAAHVSSSPAHANSASHFAAAAAQGLEIIHDAQAGKLIDTTTILDPPF